MGRPMFEHLEIPKPKVEEEATKHEEEEDDDDDEDDKPAAVTTPADTETAVDHAESSDAEPEPAIEADQAPEAEPELPAGPEEIDDEWVLYPNQEPEEQPAESAPSTAAEQEEDDDDTVTPLTASGSTPPPPPIVPPPPSAAERPEPEPTPAYADFEPPVPPEWRTATSDRGGRAYESPPARSVSLEEHREAVEDSEKRGLRRGLVAGFITGYALKAYLAGKKLKRYEKETEKRMEERDESIDRLQHEQRELHQQVDTQAEQLRVRQQAERLARPGQPLETLPPVQAVEEHLFDQEGNEIAMDPDWRIVRSPGGYAAVIDRYRRVIYNVIPYGEGYRLDQKEVLPDSIFNTDDDATKAAADGGSAQTDQYAGAGQQAAAAPPQAPPFDPEHELEAGQPRTVDVQHRLPAPRSPVVAALASPWLWTAIALLLIVYFLAALA
jgi:hypothetical protein